MRPRKKSIEENIPTSENKCCEKCGGRRHNQVICPYEIFCEDYLAKVFVPARFECKDVEAKCSKIRINVQKFWEDTMFASKAKNNKYNQRIF